MCIRDSNSSLTMLGGGNAISSSSNNLTQQTDDIPQTPNDLDDDIPF